jgi:hypothetical protein
LANTATGALIAETLAGACRPSGYPDLKIGPADLQAITPHLRRSGSSGLAWWRIRDTELRATPSAAALRHDYRFQALRCTAYEKRIEYVFRLFEQASIEAILLKGRASASFYSDVTLRPYGDIDVLVRPEDFERAEAVLHDADTSEIDCDLHDRVTDLPDRTFGELHERSRLLQINDSTIRALGIEDHLAHVCVHFIRHDAWRPVWLCDVAATLEALPDGFDWAVCAGRNAIEARWIASVIELACVLLRARARSLPPSGVSARPPQWLVKWTLSHWTNASANREPPLTPLSRFVARPGGVWRDIRGRWPTPIAAAIHFGKAPRVFPLRYQLAMFLTQGARFCGRFAVGRARR